VSKKIEKSIKIRKLKKKYLKKPKHKKNQLNQLEYLKKYLVRFGFGFINLKSKNLNLISLVKNKPNQTENRIETNPITNSKKKNSKNNIVFCF